MTAPPPASATSTSATGSGQPTRRRLLGGLAVGAVGALAGCAFLAGSRELAHYVEVGNATRDPHELDVRVRNDADEVLYARTFDLGPETVVEDTDPFTGEPTTVVLTGDQGDPRHRRWPRNRCEERGTNSAGGLDVYLTPDRVTTTLTGDTVYADGES